MTAEDRATELTIYQWHAKANIDYADLYGRLYIAYNAWYRRVTGALNDREAMRRLKMRFVIWDDYLHGKVMNELSTYHLEIVELTKLWSFPSSGSWCGRVADTTDWRGLISFWYRVRCELFHGSLSRTNPQHQQALRLAYQSLLVFMNEIIERMHNSFTDEDSRRLDEGEILSRFQSEVSDEVGRRHAREMQLLRDKYIKAAPLWAGDMARAR